MAPTFLPGQKVLVQKKWFFCKLTIGDVIILYDPRNGNRILKRITQFKNNHYFVQGDNLAESTDSRIFGWVSEKDIIGKIMC